MNDNAMDVLTEHSHKKVVDLLQALLFDISAHSLIYSGSKNILTLFCISTATERLHVQPWQLKCTGSMIHSFISNV